MLTPTQASPAAVELVTISQYIAARRTAFRANPEKEGKRLYRLVFMAVWDDYRFSPEADESFPTIDDGDFNIRSLSAWVLALTYVWLPNLSKADRDLFYGVQFIP